MSLSSWFRHFRQTPSNSPASATAPHYPPKVDLIDVVSPHDILASQSQLIDRLRLAYGVDHATFDREILQTLLRFAHCVHLLPATKDSHYRAPGGLFSLGLETAFFALQGADSQIFPGRQTISQRVTTEPRWRFATVLAGLCSQLHRTFALLQVVSESGDLWPAYSVSLYDWLKSNNHRRYAVRWDSVQTSVPALSILSLQRIVPAQTLDHLASGNRDIVPTLLAAISGTADPRGGNILDLLVRRSIAIVLERDLRLNPPIAPPAASAAIADIVIDAMTRLVESGTWSINTDKSRLWLAADGLFLIWPNAIDDLIRYFDHTAIASAPRTPQQIEDILSSRGDLAQSRDHSHAYTIYPPPKRTPQTAIKFTSPSLLLQRLTSSPSALSFALGEPPDDVALAVDNHTAVPAPAAASSHSPARLALVPSQGTLRLDDTGQPPMPTTKPPPPHSSLKLDLPSHLNPAIRDRLVSLLSAERNPSVPSSHLSFIESGNLFIPLPLLKASGLDPASTIASLSDAGVLVTPPGRPAQRTHTRDVDGQAVIGVLLSSKFLR